MRDDNCIFCKLANGDIPTTTLYEDEKYRVIFDASPASKGHVLIIPKEHYEDLTELPDEIAAGVMPLARKIGTAMKQAIGAKGFNVVQNNGEAAGQTVHHFHTHIIPRYGNDEMILWKPGTTDAEELKKTCESLKQAL
ncbi:HIT family protein [Oribacterium sp. WCC10]|uniref:HIT family protein n=1 Tax=Oribacterium sp. WCC10 TaxID=1855343 RepID=UPI0008DF7DF6|nr:HIT family protein [Oribacterium sp. WCC10]SFG14724.1 histidine triad (HIT) family protein [Oribacterium sp. WCC10]